MADELLKEVEKGIADLFKDGDEGDGYTNGNKYKDGKNPYINIEKSSVLQAARDFHDSNIVRDTPDEIISTITQLLCLQNSRSMMSGVGGGGGAAGQGHSYSHGQSQQGHSSTQLNTTEATDIFFGVTKLFVSTNNRLLRRMVYVILKDLVSLCHPSNVIIVTSCLTKDMTSSDSIYRANALRVLARIIDTPMLSALERYIKQAILESSASASLSSSTNNHGMTPLSTQQQQQQPSSSPSSVFKKYYQHNLVSSAALVSSLHLFLQSSENAIIIKRWVNEVFSALRSVGSYSGNDLHHQQQYNHNMIQFHALILYYQMKKNDRLATSKFVQQLCTSTISTIDTKGGHGSTVIPAKPRRMNGNHANSNNGVSRHDIPSLQSPLAITCLIRYTYKLLLEEVSEGRIHSFSQLSSSSSQLSTIGYQFLKSCLRHESEMIAFEAASSICSLSTSLPSSSMNETENNAAILQDIQPALSVLQLLLSSLKPAARLGTIKLLYKISMKYPQFVAGRFNDSLEALIGDSNRLIGTLSIMTLIKTFAGSTNQNGDNTAIDRLLKHISSFISHIADEYKIMVIKSLEQLCISYPMKFSIIISFLSKFLRDDGGFLFKRTIVLSIESLMEAIPETKDLALLYLCEFIEDCEYVTISTQILTLLGNVGPTTTQPARYVRFIYNRCILENAMIRASSVLALTKFGASCPSLRSSILMLLRSCLMDESDETRDRVILGISILEDAEKKYPYDPSTALANDETNDEDTNEKNEVEENDAAFLFMSKLPFSFDVLERRLKSYRATPGAMENKDLLSFSTLPIVEDDMVDEGETNTYDSDLVDNVAGSSKRADEMVVGPNAINSIPEFAAFGCVFISSAPVPLTETETEYVVHCVKHIFDEHIVLQFTTQNTIEDQRLENVCVSIDNNSDAFIVTGEMAAQNIGYGASSSCYTVLERNSEVPLASAVLNCELKFTVVHVDPATGEEEGESYEEEYPLEDLEIFTTDFIAKTSTQDFRRTWESVGNSNEILQKFALQEKDLVSAVNAVIDCMGMQTCDGTHAVKPSARQHMLHLSGTFLGGVTVVARSQISLAPSGSIVLKIAIRSEDAEVSRQIASCLG